MEKKHREPWNYLFFICAVVYLIVWLYLAHKSESLGMKYGLGALIYAYGIHLIYGFLFNATMYLSGATLEPIKKHVILRALLFVLAFPLAWFGVLTMSPGT